MRVLKLEPGDMFRAQEGNYDLSFIPNINTKRNTLPYNMHWVKAGNSGFVSFLCLGKDCPICDYAKSLASEEARQWLPKKRVLINVWVGDSSKVKVWDASAWLITKGFGAEGALLDSRLWDPSKYGIALALDVRKRGPYPEYRFTKSLRRFEIPPAILGQARNLRDLIKIPTVLELEEALDDVLDSELKIEVQRVEAVGEPVLDSPKRKRGGFPKITTTQKKKPKYQEPEPYKRVRRIIIMDEED